jgi:hypothetical protein
LCLQRDAGLLQREHTKGLRENNFYKYVYRGESV